MRRPTAKSWGKVGIFAVALCVPTAATGVAAALPQGAVSSVQVVHAGASETTLAWTQVAHTRAQPADHAVQYAGLPNIAVAFVRWLVDNLVTGADSGEAVERGSSGGRVDTALNPRYPNEPPGFVPWFEHDWQTWPDENERMFASGVGVVRVERGVDNFELIDDPDAPHGKGKSLVHRQREGQRTGTTSGTFNLFNPIDGTHTRHSNQVHLRSVYRSHWVYFEPDPTTGDWQFGDTHMRTFWSNRHYGTSPLAVSLRSPASPRDQRHNHYDGVAMWHSNPSTFYPSSRLGLSIGQWRHHEYLWEIIDGEYGVTDGITSRIRAWIDDELVIDRTITHTVQQPFANDHFAMVWNGGSGNVREQHDFVRFGDIYISGIPYQD